MSPEYFKSIPIRNEKAPVFYDATMTDTLHHYLTEYAIPNAEIVTAKAAMQEFGISKLPDVRLVPFDENTRLPDSKIHALISYLDPQIAQSRIDSLMNEPEACEYRALRHGLAYAQAAEQGVFIPFEDPPDWTPQR